MRYLLFMALVPLAALVIPALAIGLDRPERNSRRRYLR